MAWGSGPPFSAKSRKMIKILRKEGWQLNADDRKVNIIISMIERNNGECPCHNDSEDKHCPCTDYREKDLCHCGLYTKVSLDGLN